MTVPALVPGKKPTLQMTRQGVRIGMTSLQAKGGNVMNWRLLFRNIAHGA